MKCILTISLIILSSCSGINRSEHAESRSPSSTASGDACSSLVGAILNFEKGALSTDESRQIELSYALIKKKYPHFNKQQILTHYQLLKDNCL
ncbi:MAG: hypothetical protein WC635_03035 [Bacteriovorax sp.]